MNHEIKFLDAIKNDNLPECQRLFEYIENINRPVGRLTHRSEDRGPPIYFAVLNGSLEMCLWMQEVGNNLKLWKNDYHEFFPYNDTLMCAASRGGHLTVCQWILQEYGSPETLSSEDYDENTPMLHACKNGHLSVAVWLFEMGASEDIHTENSLGETPISFACKNGHLSICKWLIKVGVTFDSFIDSLCGQNETWMRKVRSTKYLEDCKCHLHSLNDWLLEVMRDHHNFTYSFLLGTLSQEKRDYSTHLGKLNTHGSSFSQKFKELILENLVGTQEHFLNILNFGNEFTHVLSKFLFGNEFPPDLSEFLSEPELERVIPKGVPTFCEFLNL